MFDEVSIQKTTLAKTEKLILELQKKLELQSIGGQDVTPLELFEVRLD